MRTKIVNHKGHKDHKGFYMVLAFVCFVFFVVNNFVSSVVAQANMNSIAEQYVRLVLAVGQHDAPYVDAFYGLPAWREDAERENAALVDIDRRAAALLGQLGVAKPSARAEELVQLRYRYLVRQLESLRSRVSMLQGKRFTFDEESQALYDAVAPTHSEKDFADVLVALERALPGGDPLIQRYDAFRNRFIVPKDKLDAVFTAAIDECRARTRRHITLPEGETFTVEYVTGKSWSGYNWYQGNYRSLIQVNTDLPIFIDRAIDLACHEGYPGHHVYNVLLEQQLMRRRGWMEFSVYALWSPQSLIAEGTANFGIEVAFTPQERLAFERQTLFPIAGLDASGAAGYYEVQALVDRLSYAGNEAARRYLNGAMSAAQAVEWLERYAMHTRQRAEQRIKFIDQFRSYVINYNLGKDLVAAYIASRGGTASAPDRRWKEFTSLLASPRLPSGLHASH
jgi:hypothetical protein